VIVLVEKPGGACTVPNLHVTLGSVDRDEKLQEGCEPDGSTPEKLELTEDRNPGVQAMVTSVLV